MSPAIHATGSHQQQKTKRVQKKVCPFDRTGVRYFDYKDYALLKPYIDYFGNIRQRYYSGLCLRHQKMLKNAVERARFMAFLTHRK
jgi:small subunit ribosomal protein S18